MFLSPIENLIFIRGAETMNVYKTVFEYEHRCHRLCELIAEGELSPQLSKRVWGEFKRITTRIIKTYEIPRPFLILEDVSVFILGAPTKIALDALKLFEKICPKENLLENLYDTDLLRAMPRKMHIVEKAIVKIFKESLAEIDEHHITERHMEILCYILIDDFMNSQTRIDIWNKVKNRELSSRALKKVYTDYKIPMVTRIEAFEKDLLMRKQDLDKFEAPWYCANRYSKVPKKLLKKVAELEAIMEKFKQSK